MIKTYYYLTKPGIIYGNLIAAIAGFFLASRGMFDPILFISMVLGLSFVIAGGCVFNNIIDRKIDAKMARTKNRALVKGKISVYAAIIFALILEILGVIFLLMTNIIALGAALLGLFFYIGPYTFAKRGTIYSTIVGSIAGAVPPVVGYTAVAARLDLGALLLFLVLVTWQMPHFYSIAIFRIKEYKAARLPVLPVVVGEKTAKVHITIYILGFIFITFLLFLTGYTGYLYLIAVMAISFIWLYDAVLGLKTKNNEVWARKMFRFSLIVLLIFCIMIALDGVR